MELNGQLHALVTLLPGKKPQSPLNRRLGRPQSWSRHFAAATVQTASCRAHRL